MSARTVSVALLLIALPFAAGAKTIVQQGESGGTKPFSYAVIEDDESSNADLVYVFHGGGGDETEVAYVAERLSAEWKKLGYQPPRFAGLSFGKIWMLAQGTGSPQSGLMDVFAGEFMPLVEKKLLANKAIGRREAIGHSMGGLNSLNLALLRPGLVSKVGLLSPALLPLSPFANDGEIADFVKRSGAPESLGPKYIGVREYLDLLKQVLLTKAQWRKISPDAQIPRLATAIPKEKLPRFYVSAGVQDKMYFLGGEHCADLLRRAGWPLTWDKRPGGHGDIDWPGLAEFLRN